MKRKAKAVWNGGLIDGKGIISTASGVLDKSQYSFKTRFENGIGTNPEELIGAAHAGCFSMALSNELGNMGFKPDTINTEAIVNFEKTDEGFTVTEIKLNVSAKVPGISEDDFMKAANNAKIGCPISRLLNTKITMDAKLN